MIIYILKFSACLAIMMIFYKLLLEKSSVHKFKRYYLLGALVFALVIPSITFVEYIEPVIVEEYTSFVISDFEIVATGQEIIEVNYTPIILWSIYGLGVMIFLLKFCLNLKAIVYRIRRNPKLKTKGFINVLVSNLKIPHTFFNYIFFNKDKFEHNDIPKEVLIHEQTHARQKHSIDVLALELLQIIFWFNPLIYLLKREVKLNHEFLADQAVLQNGIEPSTYQNILLAFSSKAQHQELANAINYSSIKKRFTVMNTHTSKTSIWLRSLLILPVLAILFYGFAEREQVERERVQPNIKNEPLESQAFNLANSKQSASISNSEIELFINDQGELLYNDEIIALEDLSSIYTLENDMNISLKTTLDVDKEVISVVTKRIQKFLRTQGLKTFSVCVSAENEDKQEGLSAKQLNEYNRLAKYYNSQPINKRIIKKVEIERLEGLYNLMSDAQKENAQPFPECPPPPPPPAPKVIHEKGFMWILLNSKGQLLVNDKLGSLQSIETEFKVIAKTKRNSKKIVFRYDENTPKDIVNKVNLLIKKYDLKNINKDVPPPPPPPVAAPIKKGNGPNGSTYYPIPPPIPDDATPEQSAKMQAAIDDFEKTYKRKVHQAKSENGEVYSLIVNDEVYNPSQDENNIKTGFIKIHGTPHYFVTINEFTKYYNRQGFEVNKSGKTVSANQVNASDVIPGQYITKVHSDGQIVSEFKDNKPSKKATLVDIPPPPAPISTLDFIIDLAKKNAKFYYKNETISSDKAIELLKQNPDLNVLANDTKKKQPQVYISIEPISLKKTKNNLVGVLATNELDVMFNGKTPVDGQITLSKKELTDLKLTMKKLKIKSFKLKIQGKRSQLNPGNSLNEASKSYVRDISVGSIIQFFDIKSSNGIKLKPIVVSITK